MIFNENLLQKVLFKFIIILFRKLHYHCYHINNSLQNIKKYYIFLLFWQAELLLLLSDRTSNSNVTFVQTRKPLLIHPVKNIHFVQENLNFVHNLFCFV